MESPTEAIAPDWHIVQWFNTSSELTLQELRGKVVVLHAFQMLCPGCVSGGLPQVQRIERSFDPTHLAVIGIHTVFEHHDVMRPQALEVFIREYGLTFPIGVDRPGTSGPIPQTMAAYAMQGTPTLVLIDRRGRLRKHAFGTEDDMRVGADIALLLAEQEYSDDA